MRRNNLNRIGKDTLIMPYFENTSFDNHEHVSFFSDPETGLKAIIAIHNTNLGPGLGGCRMWSYASDDEALTDVLRLSRGMTYKAALAGLKLGGGKSVIIGDARTQKTPELFEAMGRFVEKLGGDYIIAEDVGTSVEDMVSVSKHTSAVVGLPTKEGSDHASGDPSPVTAWGVFLGIKASVSHRLKKESLEGVHVAVQGLGSVGMALCGYLHKAGAHLTVADIFEGNVEKAQQLFGADVVSPQEIYGVEADVFAPCALGGVINDETLDRFKVSVIAGAANNQLLEDKHGMMLHQRGILQAPDFVINAGGLINVYYERMNQIDTSRTYTRDDVMKHLDIIDVNLRKIFEISDQKNISTSDAAEDLAESIFLQPSLTQEDDHAAA